MDAEKLLEISKSAQKMTVKTSTIAHHDDMLGLSTSRATGKDEIVWYYYGFLDYANLIKKWHKIKTNGEVVTQVTARPFRK